MDMITTVTFDAVNQPDEFGGPAPFNGSASFMTRSEAKAFAEVVYQAGLISIARMTTEEDDGRLKVEWLDGGVWTTLRDDTAKPLFDLGV